MEAQRSESAYKKMPGRAQFEWAVEMGSGLEHREPSETVVYLAVGFINAPQFVLSGRIEKIENGYIFLYRGGQPGIRIALALIRGISTNPNIIQQFVKR